MADTRIVNLVIAMRKDPGLLWDVESFVTSEHGSRASTIWRAIRSHSAVDAETERRHIYEAALDLGMRLHPARAKALEGVA